MDDKVIILILCFLWFITGMICFSINWSYERKADVIEHIIYGCLGPIAWAIEYAFHMNEDPTRYTSDN